MPFLRFCLQKRNRKPNILEQRTTRASSYVGTASLVLLVGYRLQSSPMKREYVTRSIDNCYLGLFRVPDLNKYQLYNIYNLLTH